MNISSVLVSPCSERGTHGAAPTDGHSEGGTAAAAAAAAAVPSSGGRALHTIMLEPGRARGGRGHGRSQGESRDESRGGSVVVRKRSSVGARSTFEWRPVTVEAEVLHAEVLLEHAPVSRPRWLSLRPAGAPEAPSLSVAAHASGFSLTRNRVGARVPP